MADFLMVVLVCVSFFLIFVVLLQRGRGGGLAGAFGGLGGQSAFGTKAGDLFTRITIVAVAIWVMLAGMSGYMARESAKRFDSDDDAAAQKADKDDDDDDGGGMGAGDADDSDKVKTDDGDKVDVDDSDKVSTDKDDDSGKADPDDDSDKVNLDADNTSSK
jgi:preprotein translocase subunit SecG